MKYPINKTGIALFIVFFAVYFLSRVYAKNLLFASIQFPDYLPSDQPPWYFIHQDMATAMAQGIGLLLILALAAIVRKKTPFYANMVAWQALLWMGYTTFFGIIILLNTQHLFNPESATTVWQTQKAYLNSFTISTFVYLTLWGIFSFIWRRRQRKLVIAV